MFRPGLGILLVLCCVAAGCGSGSPPHDLGCAGFSLSDWKDRSRPLERTAPARALASCDLLKGKSEARVEQILGRPDERHDVGRSATQLTWFTSADVAGDQNTYLLVRIDGASHVAKYSFIDDA